jgi:uncharacterized membrane protein
VLIYFIHYIAVSIQLPGVLSSIAANLAQATDLQFPQAQKSDPKIFATGRSPRELTARRHAVRHIHPDAGQRARR